jgi:hypothetical protein
VKQRLGVSQLLPATPPKRLTYLRVAETWLKLARSSASDDEFKETAEVVGW